jgi:NADH-quinone oxidoreductase subunit F
MYGKPTTINNTETFRVGAWINNGADAFLNLGKPNNGGYISSFSVSGDVRAARAETLKSDSDIRSR